MSRSITNTSRRIAMGLMVAAVFSSAAAACASDGRELAEGRPWQTTTTRPLPPTSAPPRSQGVTSLELSSPDFEPGAIAPLDSTCAGANLPPSLEWSLADDTAPTDTAPADTAPADTAPADTAPTDTAEWAVSLSDQTDPENPLLLWLVVGIEPTVGQLVSGDLGTADETLNDYGQLGYGNPCIETLSAGRRDLQFRVYSLAQSSGIEPGAPGNESWDRIAAMANDSATLMMQVDANP